MILNVLHILLIIPLVMLIIFLLIHWRNTVKEIRTLTTVIFILAVAKLTDFIIQIVVTYALSQGKKPAEVVHFLIIGAFLLAFANWWALFKILKLRNNDQTDTKGKVII